MRHGRGERRRAWLALASLVLVLAGASPATAASWSSVFANETDTTAFLTADGGLVRAPFSLATIDTMWTPTKGDYVARVRVRPGGGRIAWLTRVGDEGLTWLWTDGDGSPRSHVGFLPLQPRRLGVQRFEAEGPTNEDLTLHGARLLAPSATSRRISTNGFEWTPDGSSVVFAFAKGLGLSPADSGAAREVSTAQFASVTLLDPAPFYLVEVVRLPDPEAVEAAPEPEFDVLDRGRQHVTTTSTIHWYLLYPGTPPWKLFESSGFDGTHRWTADEGTVWWADRKTVRAVHSHNPKPQTFANAPDEIVWLEHDAGRHAVAWVAGRKVARQPAEGGRAETVFSTKEPTTRVFTTDRARVLWAGDSLIVWRPEDDHHAAVALAGVEPASVVEGADSTLFVTGGRKSHSAASVYRVDLEHSRLVATDSPESKDGVLVASPSHERLLWFKPAAKAPAKLAVYEIATGAWAEVENPGVIGWESLGMQGSH